MQLKNGLLCIIIENTYKFTFIHQKLRNEISKYLLKAREREANFLQINDLIVNAWSIQTSLSTVSRDDADEKDVSKDPESWVYYDRQMKRKRILRKIKSKVFLKMLYQIVTGDEYSGRMFFSRDCMCDHCHWGQTEPSPLTLIINR